MTSSLHVTKPVGNISLNFASAKSRQAKETLSGAINAVAVTAKRDGTDVVVNPNVDDVPRDTTSSPDGDNFAVADSAAAGNVDDVDNAADVDCSATKAAVADSVTASGD